MLKIIRLLFIANLVFSANYLNAWGFGKNKLVTKTFDWKVKSSQHFNIYYYGQSGKNLLPYTESYLEKAYYEVTKKLPAEPSEKIPLFLYNNHNDFEQTNITMVGEGTGGVTEAYKNRFLVGHLGSQRYLEYVLAHEFTHEIQYEYLFKGFWKSLRLVKFIFYPLWLMEGLAEYTKGDLDSTNREMYLRDAVLNNNLIPLSQLHHFNHVMPHQVTLAYKESEALMHFIAAEYGKDKLPVLLRAYRDKLDTNKVLLDTLGISFSRLEFKFMEYMEERYRNLSDRLWSPDKYGVLLTEEGNYPRFYESAEFLPSGDKVVYLSDERGQNEIFIMDINTNESSCLWDMTGSISVENIHSDGRAVSVSPGGNSVVFGGEKEQKDFLYIYDFKRDKLSVVNVNTESVASPEFSYNGKEIFYSGLHNGFRNIFKLDINSGELTQLTTGYMDKIDTVCSDDGRYIIYSCERKNTLDRTEYDLCIMNLESNKTEFITSLSGDERYPCFSADNKKIYFTSDQDGVNDIYVMDLKSSEIARLTHVIGGNFQPEISPDGKTMMFSSFYRGGRHLYLSELDSIEPEMVSFQDNSSKGGSKDQAQVDIVESKQNGNEYVSQPYKFKVSTDLFFPALIYSSIDGLYLATYWQMSEFLGNHQLRTTVQFASAVEYLDYDVTYGFLRYRPQFYFNFRGQEYQEYHFNEDEIKKKEENAQYLITVYPLNRFQRVELLMGTIGRREYWIGQNQAQSHKRENIAGFAFSHDVTQRPYLEITSGWRMRAACEFSDKVLNGDYRYQNYILEAHRFFPLGKEHVLGWRTFLGGSFGPDAGWFRIGGDDRIRGIPREVSSSSPYAGKKILLNNIEWRFPLVGNINYHMKFMFPDFFFKTFYGALFFDSGFVFNEDSELENISLEKWKSSFGCSFRFHTFIMQSYPVLLNAQFARHASNSDLVFYLTLGTNF